MENQDTLPLSSAVASPLQAGERWDYRAHVAAELWPQAFALLYKARRRQAVRLGFSEVEVPDVVDGLGVGVGVLKESKFSVYCGPKRPYEWVYDHFTDSCSREEEAGSGVSFLYGQYSVVIGKSFWGREFDTATHGSLLGYKTPVSASNADRLKAMRDSKAFNAFEVVAMAESFRDPDADGRGAVILGVIWEYPPSVFKTDRGRVSHYQVMKW